MLVWNFLQTRIDIGLRKNKLVINKFYIFKNNFLLIKMAVESEILDELKKIRVLLEPEEEPKEEPKKKKKFPVRVKDDFVEFLKSYKVMGVAVAFIMALYFKEVVDALIADIIMPIIQYIPGASESWEFFLGPFAMGHFLSVILSFLIIAFVVFLLVKLSKKIGLD